MGLLRWLLIFLSRLVSSPFAAVLCLLLLSEVTPYRIPGMVVQIPIRHLDREYLLEWSDWQTEEETIGAFLNRHEQLRSISSTIAGEVARYSDLLTQPFHDEVRHVQQYFRAIVQNPSTPFQLPEEPPSRQDVVNKISLVGGNPPREFSFFYLTSEAENTGALFLAKCDLFCTYYSLYKSSYNCAEMIFTKAREGLGLSQEIPSILRLKANLISRRAFDPLGREIDVSNMIPAEMTWHEKTHARQHYVNASQDLFESLWTIRQSLLHLDGFIEPNQALDQFLAGISRIGSEVEVEVHPEWIDSNTCLHVLTNATFCKACWHIAPFASNDTEMFGMRDELASASVDCSGSIFASNWKPVRWIKPYHHQHVPILRDNRLVGNVPSDFSIPRKIFISIHDLFSCTNIAHAIDSVEVFWSFASAALRFPRLKDALAGSVIFALRGEACIRSEGNPREALDFVKLIYRTVVRFSAEQNLLIYSFSSDQLFDVLDRTFDSKLPQEVYDKYVLDLKIDTVFPVLLDRPLHNVLTPDGAALMRDSMIQECQLSDLTSPQANAVKSSTGSSDYYNHIVSGSDGEFIVIASRAGPRYIYNLEQVRQLVVVWASSEPQFQSLSVIEVNFGKLSPCEQLEIASRSRIFFFVHGAEGALISFLRPNSVVVEIHPAGCCVDDFDHNPSYKRYYEADAHAVRARHIFFSGTIASSWLCHSWQAHLMVAKNCGTIILLDLFSELLDNINSIF